MGKGEEKNKKRSWGREGEARGVSERTARGGRWRCGERAWRRELSGPLQTAARAAAPESSELAEPGCISSRSCELSAGSQGDVPGSILLPARGAAAGASSLIPTSPPPGLRVCVCVSARVWG